MRKKILHLIILSFSLLWGGCSQVDFYADFATMPQNPKGKTDVNFNVGLTDVEAFVKILNTDADGLLRKEVKKITPIVHNRDTLVYLVNYEDNKGWLIVSGDKRTTGILAYADEGVFETESLNPGQMTWLDDLANQIYVLKTQVNLEADTLAVDFQLWNKIETYVANTAKINSSVYQAPVDPSKPIIDPDFTPGHWDLIGITTQDLSPTQVGPLIQTKWGQSAPWNTCVPFYLSTGERCVTGCVAVAGAQMLYYLHYLWGVPATMVSSGSFSGWSYDDSYNYSYAFGSRTNDVWDGMARRISWGWDNNGKLIIISNAGTQLVAAMMGYIGVRIGMKWGGNQSSASTENLVGFFSEEGINSSYLDFNSSNIVPSLNNNLPVIIKANASQNNHTFLGLIHLYYTYDDGHAWIIDGYENWSRKYTYTYQWWPDVMPNPPVPIPYITKSEEEIVTSPNYFFMNWGWDENHDNGKYAMGNDAVWTISDLDENWNLKTYNFQYQKKMIKNFSKK